ncbi:hypothetical protein E7V67_016255 [[Empedobacter] haloabium]|uniref:Uncharacterized protein n=1 Tax=[Empedobacter] haloabium TaxID=592317 RepID=A0ABZ1UGF4_9BURK
MSDSAKPIVSSGVILALAGSRSAVSAALPHASSTPSGPRA